jgi:hypothetical protein
MGVVLVCFDPFLGFHSMKAHSHPQRPSCKRTWFVLHDFQRICLRVILSACLCFWLFPDGNKKKEKKKKKKKKKLWWWVGEKRTIFFSEFFSRKGFVVVLGVRGGKESGAWTRVGISLFVQKEGGLRTRYDDSRTANVGARKGRPWAGRSAYVWSVSEVFLSWPCVAYQS